MINISNISHIYLFVIEDCGEIYTYDIRTLMRMDINKIINVYTGNIIHKLVCNNITKKIKYLYKLGYLYKANVIMNNNTPNDITYRLFRLNFEFKQEWIMNLTMRQIKKLHRKLYYQWHNLNNDHRNIINNRLYADIPDINIYLQRFKNISLLKISTFALLNEYINNYDMNHAKSGALLFLTVLITVSPPAYDGLTYLHYE